MPSLKQNGNGHGSDSPRPLYWRSEEHLKNSDRFRHWLEHEFPEPEGAETGGDSSLNGVSRRGFLGVMGASMALAGFTGCRKPVEKIVPYVQDVEYHVQGVPRMYATAQPRGTAPLGVLVETHQGRPTKVEGNELHPTSGGGVDSFALASVLDLYDPDRSKFPTKNGSRRSWDEFVEAWREIHPDLIANGGKGLAIVSDAFASPTLARLRETMKSQLPNARWIAWEPVSTENRDKGLEKALGRPVAPVYRFDKAGVILSLDSDFILTEPDAVRHNRDFGSGRKLSGPKDSMNRLYVVESGLTVTGGKADHRLALQSSQIGAFAASLAMELGRQGVSVPGLRGLGDTSVRGFQKEWIQPLAEDLVRHRGEVLITAGLRQPPAVHALVAAMNSALGALGRTVRYQERKDTLASSSADLKKLADAMMGEQIDTAVFLGANPLHDAPSDIDLREALRRVRTTIHLGPFVNETARACDWHVPQSSFMESWGDVRASTGTASLIQPQIQPLYDTKSDIELANLIITGEDTRGYELVRDTWMNGLISGDERKWKQSLHDGLLDEGQPSGGPGVIDAGGVASALSNATFSTTPAGFEVVFATSNTLQDGRYANNAWMVELPDPITKASWGNHAVMSRRTADELGVDTGDGVTVQVQGRQVEAPAFVLPGHADGSITLELGWGATRDLGRVNSETLGVDVYPLRRSDNLGFAVNAQVVPSGRFIDVPNVQDHGAMEGREIVREATLETYRHEPAFAKHMVHVPDLDSLWKDHTYQSGYQWGMAIDLNACTNCNACVTACQSENNIPVVGKQRVGYGREMHWLRLDRYFVGDADRPRIANQPMMCQHCEMAPCEQVCPVNATVHDSEGLNVMTYNRCIGTRYCSNNCPYKVRRFNFFAYTNEYPEVVKMAQNPDVTVRSRGVMEKCTFCLQRISLAKQRAKADGRVVKDADLQTACQQACPPNAISFGNINDPDSEVSKQRRSDRAYGVLEEFNTRPRVQYLAGVINPNPKMPHQPAVEVEAAHGGGHGGGHGEATDVDTHRDPKHDLTPEGGKDHGGGH